MSSSNDSDPTPSRPARPRRGRSDRDSFIEEHGRDRATSPADDTDTSVIEKVTDETPAPVGDETVPSAAETAPIIPVDADAETDIGEPEAEPEPEPTTRLPRSDVPVQSSDEPVHTEPFADPDDENDRPRAERSTAEHLTEDPLPYIEPQPTTPIETSAEYQTEPFDDEPVVEPEPAPVVEQRVRRGTLDLGLLILRVAVGVVFTLHGLQKLTGWMNGPGPDGFADFLRNLPDPSIGFDADAAKWLALVAGVSETAGGILLILGLLTPIAGSAVLGTVLVAMTYKATLAGGVWFFAADGGGNGVEFEATLACAAAALILAGPGTYSFDRRWGWSRRPAWGSAVWLLIGIGAAVATWIVFNGTNPLVDN